MNQKKAIKKIKPEEILKSYLTKLVKPINSFPDLLMRLRIFYRLDLIALLKILEEYEIEIYLDEVTNQYYVNPEKLEKALLTAAEKYRNERMGKACEDSEHGSKQKQNSSKKEISEAELEKLLTS